MKKTLILLFAISSFILPIYSEENVLQNTEITDAQNSLENEEQNITETVPKIEEQNIIKNEENITQTNSDDAKIETLEDLANFSELSDTENQKTEDNIEDANLNSASEKVLENVSESERKKAYYIDINKLRSQL